MIYILCIIIGLIFGFFIGGVYISNKNFLYGKEAKFDCSKCKALNCPKYICENYKLRL